MTFYAHTLEGRPEPEWQSVSDHLIGVAERARRFAEVFSNGEWGFAAGLLHDLGKYSHSFQEYLRAANAPDSHAAEATARVDHSSAGAQYAVDRFNLLGHLLAYPIAGHHSGLLDGRSEGACLDARLKKAVDGREAPSVLVEKITSIPLPHAVKESLQGPVRDPFRIAFFVRMIFSCLVDADFLDTEAFMDRERAATRPNWSEEVLPAMLEALHEFVGGFPLAETVVDQERERVRKECLSAAKERPGLFSLTVPTGGGKTLSSLAFALQHAICHGHRRVVYVIPYTSIIEQNAAVFRKVMQGVSSAIGHDVVLEHHSNVDVGTETVVSRLAAENWDAPLIVTTSVQFYESLFANRSSRCRKLHNLAGSVIILDEAQTLPVHYLEPCLRALRVLVTDYRTSIVLCTATQPAIHKRPEFPIGLEAPKEIVSEPENLYQRFKRVDVIKLDEQPDVELAERLLSEQQVLCILNTRLHAQELFSRLGQDTGHFHLSTFMCPEHRSEALEAIQARLRRGEVCRVVSTQLVEAGVDIDFPTVFRSIAGVDSIAQAAGRCNRNGNLPGRGKTFIFRSEHKKRERIFADSISATTQTMHLHEDPISLAAIKQFFKLYYWDKSDKWDARQICDAFQLIQDASLPFSFSFKEVASAFRLIEETGKPVVIPWGTKGRELVDSLRKSPFLPNRAVLRGLQRYTIQIPRNVWEREIDRTIELVHGRFPVVINMQSSYSNTVGFLLEPDTTILLNA